MEERELPFDPDEVCTVCGAAGAYDFMGEKLCAMCAFGELDDEEDEEWLSEDDEEDEDW